MLQLYRAERQDAKLLSEIAKESKAHWGYPAEWLSQWTEELTISEQQIVEDYVVKAVDDNDVMGFAVVREIKDSKTVLDLQHLWIRPAFLKQGIGRLLFDHAIIHCSKVATCTHLQVLSDPYAQGFYEAMKCKVIEQQPSSIAGRTLPLMQRPINH